MNRELNESETRVAFKWEGVEGSILLYPKLLFFLGWVELQFLFLSFSREYYVVVG